MTGEPLAPGLFAHVPPPQPSAPPVHVAIDALASVPGCAGHGRLQTRIVRELATHWSQAITGTVLVRPNSLIDDIALPLGWSRAVLGQGRDVVRNAYEIPTVLRRLRPEIYLTETDRLRVPAGLPVLLYALEHPAYRARMDALTSATSAKVGLSNAVTQRWFRQTVRRADAIVTASTSTARDLLFFAGADPARISVAPHGPFIDTTPAANAERRARTVLAFVDSDPRDNGVVVLRAFQDVPEPWTLEIVGDAEAALGDHIHALGLIGRVHLHGRVSDARVAELFGSCGLFLEASLYEGYGAQTSEAVSAGARCIVSWVTSLPEITSLAPSTLFVNPHDPRQVREVLLRAIREGDMAVPSPPSMTGSPGGWGELAGHLVSTCQVLRGSR